MSICTCESKGGIRVSMDMCVCTYIYIYNIPTSSRGTLALCAFLLLEAQYRQPAMTLNRVILGLTKCLVSECERRGSLVA